MDVAPEVAAAVVSATAGLLVGGWWTRANERQRQLREVMLTKSEEISEAASRLVSKLGPWNRDDWPQPDRIAADPAKWQNEMDDAEKMANAEASALIGLTSLYFRITSVQQVTLLVFYTRAAAQAGREAAVSPERLVLFGRFKKKAWEAFTRLHGELQRDLVGFPSPFGRFIKGRWQARKTGKAVQRSEQNLAELSRRVSEMGARLERSASEQKAYLKELDDFMKAIDDENVKEIDDEKPSASLA